MRSASCECGQLRLALHGEPVRVSVCHCLACQRRTGSVFGAQARFHRDQVGSISGETAEYVRSGDAGGKVCMRFCPKCGSTVYWSIDALPDFYSVAVGAFADPGFVAPSISVYDDRRHPWVEVRNVERYE